MDETGSTGRSGRPRNPARQHLAAEGGAGRSSEAVRSRPWFLTSFKDLRSSDRSRDGTGALKVSQREFRRTQFSWLPEDTGMVGEDVIEKRRYAHLRQVNAQVFGLLRGSKMKRARWRSLVPKSLLRGDLELKFFFPFFCLIQGKKRRDSFAKRRESGSRTAQTSYPQWEEPVGKPMGDDRR